MSRYERTYDTDWDSLDKDGAIDRAYALGVAASLGEYHPDELEAIRGEMESAYEKSVVDLAFEEGRTEGRTAGSETDEGGVWSRLVAGETVTADPDETPRTGGRTGLPEALDRPALDSTEAVELPEFLRRD